MLLPTTRTASRRSDMQGANSHALETGTAKNYVYRFAADLLWARVQQRLTGAEQRLSQPQRDKLVQAVPVKNV